MRECTVWLLLLLQGRAEAQLQQLETTAAAAAAACCCCGWALARRLQGRGAACLCQLLQLGLLLCVAAGTTAAGELRSHSHG